MLAFFSPWGIATLLASLVALYHGLVPGTKPVVMPSPTGLYVGFEDDAGNGQRDALSAWDYAIIAGLLLAGRAVESFVATERSAWGWISIISVAGLYLLYHAVRRTGAPVLPRAPRPCGFARSPTPRVRSSRRTVPRSGGSLVRSATTLTAPFPVS